MEITWVIDHPWLGMLLFPDEAYLFVCRTWRVVISDTGNYAKIRREHKNISQMSVGRARRAAGMEKLPYYQKAL